MSQTWDNEFERIMRQALRLLPDEEALLPDQDSASVGLDSLAIVELLLSIEDTYEILIPDELLRHQTFVTPGALWRVVCDLRESPETEGRCG